MSKNEFTGVIPSEMGNLLSTFELNLSGNKLKGSIPSDFKQLHFIQNLYLLNNFLSGTIPAIFDNMNQLQEIYLSHNKFTGSIPDSLWNLPSLDEVVDIESNQLTGVVPDSFCVKIKEKFQIDNLPWFEDMKIECLCCGSRPECYVWNIEKVSEAGTTRPPCPEHNIHTIEYQGIYSINDVTSNVTSKADVFANIGFANANICLSPTGCYEVKQGLNLSNWETVMDLYPLNYNASSLSLSKQNECDTVSICGAVIDSNHPKRAQLNHLTQLVIPSMTLLNEQNSFTYKALCWILTEDIQIEEYEVCDGTLLQRYVMALFYMSHPETFTFADFSKQKTCDWPGISCKQNEKYITQINLPGKTLQGSIMTQLGLLQSLEVIDFSFNQFTGTLVTEIGLLMNLKTFIMANNQLSGIINPLIFANLDNLVTFDMSNNELAGRIPKKLFEPPQLKHIGLGSNLFVGTLSNEIVCSQSLGKWCK